MRIIIIVMIIMFIIVSPALAFDVPQIGESKINSASPIYFVKTIMEMVELKLARTSRVLALRRLEFAQRRLREVKGLIRINKQDLIAQTLEYYKENVKAAISSSLDDIDLSAKVGDILTNHMLSLEDFYTKVSDPMAQRSIRASIYTVQRYSPPLFAKLDSQKYGNFKTQAEARFLISCDFIQKESTNSTLTQADQEILKIRALDCHKNLQKIASHSAKINAVLP